MAKRILVVDDDPVIRTLTTECLKALGHEVEAVDCGEACLSRLKSGPAPDVVFLDMMMPTLTGVDVLREIRASEATCGLKVVMLSAANEAEQVLSQHSLKADGCLLKPFQMKQLSALLATLP